MEGDERNGMAPQKVAQKIYRAARAKNPKPAYIVGLTYNIFILLNKLFPKQFVQFVLNKMYAN